MVQEGISKNGRFTVELNEGKATVGFYYGKDKEHYFDTVCEATDEAVLSAKKQLKEYAKLNSVNQFTRDTIQFNEEYDGTQDEEQYELYLVYSDGDEESLDFSSFDEAKNMLDSFDENSIGYAEIRHWVWNEEEEDYDIVYTTEEDEGDLVEESTITEVVQDTDLSGISVDEHSVEAIKDEEKELGTENTTVGKTEQDEAEAKKEDENKAEVTEDVDWNYYDKFKDVEDKYLPDQGEGDNMATQMVTAVTKLVYKHYNDGDVYDNTHSLQGWANDLSDYANWLYKYVPETSDLLEAGAKASNDGEYEDILRQVTDITYSKEMLDKYEAKPAEGSIYNCDGPFEFVEFSDDDEDDDYFDDYGVFDDDDPGDENGEGEFDESMKLDLESIMNESLLSDDNSSLNIDDAKYIVKRYYQDSNLSQFIDNIAESDNGERFLIELAERCKEFID